MATNLAIDPDLLERAVEDLAVACAQEDAALEVEQRASLVGPAEQALHVRGSRVSFGRGTRGVPEHPIDTAPGVSMVNRPTQPGKFVACSASPGGHP